MATKKAKAKPRARKKLSGPIEATCPAELKIRAVEDRMTVIEKKFSELVATQAHNRDAMKQEVDRTLSRQGANIIGLREEMGREIKSIRSLFKNFAEATNEELRRLRPTS